jgi:homotetrameric cytidine deaminase
MNSDAPAIPYPIDDPMVVRLRALALEALERAYAPYSCHPVRAVGLCADGSLAVGSNVENASYWLTLCAECALAGDVVRLGGTRLVAAYVLRSGASAIMPCVRCRQVLFELGGNDLVVLTESVRTTLGALLPSAFDLVSGSGAAGGAR